MRHVIDRSFPRVFECVVDQDQALSSSQNEGRSDEDSSGFSLRDILPGSRIIAADDIAFESVAQSADAVVPGQLVLYRLGQDCPSKLIANAMARGAAGIVTEQLLPCPLPQCIVGDVELAAGEIASATLAQPDRKVLTIGVIGSAGKTSTSLLIASLFRADGIRTAYQTDLGESDGIVQTAAQDAMPRGAGLVEWIGDAADAGCQAAIIELDTDVSRHGGYESIRFDLLVVTGKREPDRDFGESGLQCVLDRLTSTGVVVAPADDPAILRVVRDTCPRVVSYGVRRAADVTAKIIEQADGMTTLMLSHDRMTAVMESPLGGSAMASNHAAAATVGLLIEQPLYDIAARLGQLRTIPGRGEVLSEFGRATVVLDRGGSPDRAAETFRWVESIKRGGRFWCVLTVDANAAPETLARYGQLLERFADQAIVTSDGVTKPKFLAASHCVLDGVERCAAMRLVADPQRAVEWVLAEAKQGDTVLVLGGLGATSAHQQRAEAETLRRWVESSERGKSCPNPSVNPGVVAEIYQLSDYRD